CTGSSLSTEPGSREAAGAWFGLGSITSRILDIQEKIADTHQAMAEALRETDADYAERIEALEEKRREAPRLGLPVITDSKSDYAEEIAKLRAEQGAEKADVREDHASRETALEREIKAALATPPSGSARERMETIRRGTATREAFEVYNAMRNLRESVLALNERLRAESSNYELAATTYRSQIQLYRYVIQMNREFRERIESVYRPGMKSIERRIAPAITNTRASALPEAQKAREIEKLEQIRDALQRAYPKLDEHKAWAAENIAMLEKLLNMHETLLANVEIAGDAAALIAQVNAEIASLDFEPPELIEYDLEAGDFEIRDAGAGGE
ncbi:MAG TPA: hypothetical protein VF254_03790, partial [Gammaproteobacteria bacterium]